jgi:alginate O-acetyltransferase complex protein AlgI
MVFNSLQFLFFFLAVTCLYFALPHRFRWMLLLFASCFFYMAFVPIYILILFFTIVIDYYAGIMIEGTETKKKRYLIYSLVANIGVLAIFKYYNFINLNLSAVLHAVGMGNPLPAMSLLLPIGLSFHTFQAMSYTIEVYRGHQKAERHFGIYALYVMFYPQLVAGPIERPQNLLPQFRARHEWDYDRFKSGIMLILQGLFKKVVIADRLALIVDNVYNFDHNYTTANLLVAIVFFSFQIYCDFSGYSDIAIGTARVMGFKLMENFRAPYFSTSIAEFWRRWHISLSTWFKDYLYIPLGGNRVSILRWYFNIMLVFVISGLWHGASWRFLIWGALHGIFQIVAHLKGKYLPKLPKAPAFLQTLSVFALVSFAWIFFRLGALSRVKLALKGLWKADWRLVNLDTGELWYCLLLIVGLNLYDYYLLNKKGVGVRYFYPKVISLVAIIYLLGVFSQSQFIYFQF